MPYAASCQDNSQDRNPVLHPLSTAACSFPLPGLPGDRVPLASMRVGYDAKGRRQGQCGACQLACPHADGDSDCFGKFNIAP